MEALWWAARGEGTAISSDNRLPLERFLVIRNFKRTAAVFGVLAASSTALVACGNDDNGNGGDGDDNAAGVELPGGYTLSGTAGELVAEGASSQQNAMDYFSAKYQEVTGGEAALAYNASGSGAGREQFVAGQVTFAGSDSPLEEQQVEAAKDRCNGNDAWHLPFVIGPIAIAYNLEGVDELNLSVDTVAAIFKGDITEWNDDAIAAENEGVDLPDEQITTVYRADESGTSENFQKFLGSATDNWDTEGKNFPTAVGQGADGSSGVTNLVSGTNGAITYVEHAHAAQSGLGVANIDFGAGPTELNNETVGAALENLEFENEGNDMVVNSEALFSSEDEGAYPMILTAYEIVCSAGYTAEEGNMVKDFLMTALAFQDEGLEEAGHIPVTGAHYDRLVDAVNAIEVSE